MSLRPTATTGQVSYLAESRNVEETTAVTNGVNGVLILIDL